MLRTQLSVCLSKSISSLEDIASTHKGLARVVLKKGKSQIFKDGNPMVYSGAVHKILGRPGPRTGDMVLVQDGSDKPVGWGLYNSVSMFCVRLMQLDEESKRDSSCVLNMEKLLEERFLNAVDLRKNLGLPSNHTNVYRLINSEGDRLSGLIVDIFDEMAVIASSAAWVEKYRNEIESQVLNINGVKQIHWRSSVEMLKEEGLEITQQKENNESNEIPQNMQVVENGVKYKVSPEGQKTGFYADQRENRDFISRICNGKRVLDLYCYSGGFALNALKGGASHVIGVDSSLSAIELAKENIGINDFDSAKISFVKEDAIEFMKNAISQQDELYDVVILDPPKLAPRKKVLQNACGKYRNINSLAMRLVKKGGFLMTCSCSGAMTQSSLFIPTLQGAALNAGRKITVLREEGAAWDHPIDPAYPEGKYLTNILLRVV